MLLEVVQPVEASHPGLERDPAERVHGGCHPSSANHRSSERNNVSDGLGRMHAVICMDQLCFPEENL